MTRGLLIVNGPAYGSDETYDTLRLATAHAERDGRRTRRRRTDRLPHGGRRHLRDLRPAHPGRVLTPSTACCGPSSAKGGTVACCGTCPDARGLTPDRLIAEARRSTMAELAAFAVKADRVLTF